MVEIRQQSQVLKLKTLMILVDKILEMNLQYSMEIIKLLTLTADVALS